MEWKGFIIVAIDTEEDVGKQAFDILKKMMQEMGGIRTVGPPSRGPLERGASRLLKELQ